MWNTRSSLTVEGKSYSFFVVVKCVSYVCVNKVLWPKYARGQLSLRECLDFFLRFCDLISPVIIALNTIIFDLVASGILMTRAAK